MHFLGDFHAPKPFASGDRLLGEEVHFCFRLSASVFGPWGLLFLGEYYIITT